MSVTRAFPYSGSKARYIKYYPRPPKECKRIVELFCGSAVYALNQKQPWVGYETNSTVVDLWHWLAGQTDESIRELPEYTEKFDLATLNIPPGMLTYYRLCACGVFKGQLGSWLYYPQHNLPKKSTSAALPRIRQGTVLFESFSEYKYEDGDFVFIDPPYLGTVAAYNDKKTGVNHGVSVDFDAIGRIIDSLPATNSYIFTYQKPILGLDFREACKVRLPNFYGGEAKYRSEYFATNCS